MRKKLANNTGDSVDVDEDLSSEEELYDGINSDDIDSDDLNEPPEQFRGFNDSDITEHDFIGLT